MLITIRKRKLLFSLFLLFSIENHVQATSPINCFELSSSKHKIIGYKCLDQDIMIPRLINDNVVTAVGEYAFSGKQLTSVIIPDSITEIGQGAFSENRLTKIMLPDSVTTIRPYAFHQNKIEEMITSKNLTLIQGQAFTRNKLKQVIFYNHNTNIEQNAFDSNVVILRL